MLDKLWTEVAYVALDFELSGAKSEKSGICEIGGVRISYGGVLPTDVYTTLINPEEEITPAMSKAHHIRRTEIKSAKTFAAQRLDLTLFIAERIIVAHKAEMVVACFQKEDYIMPVILDTALLARVFSGKNRESSLSDLVGEYELQHHMNTDFMLIRGRGRNFDTAYYDALATAHVFVRLVYHHRPQATLGELVEICGYKAA